MLSTLTFLTGSYTVANVGLFLRNTALVKNGDLLTIRGKKTLRLLPIKNAGIMYKVYVENNKGPKCIKYGYNFDMNCKERFVGDSENNLIFGNSSFKLFENEIEYNNFCKEVDISQTEYYSNIHIEYEKVKEDDRIWVLVDNKNINSYEVVAKMDNDAFKKLMVEKFQLPYNKVVLCLFVLLALYYETS